MALRVFIIEDEECVANTLKWHLEEQGHEVLVSDRPSGCVVYCGHDCDKNEPCGHVLFLDYYLPEMTAFEFIEKMVQRGCKGATRNKILMSGNITAIDKARAKRLGCEIIQKPFSLDEVDRIMLRISAEIDPGENLADLEKLTL